MGIGAEGESQIDQAFSREFCGGTHVDRLGSIGGFKIIKEESISAGVRRITALTGQGLTAYLEKASDIVDELSVVLKVPSEALVDRVGQLIKDNKKLSKQLRSAAASGSDTMAEAKQLLEKCEKGGQNIFNHRPTLNDFGRTGPGSYRYAQEKGEIRSYRSGL